LCSFYAAFRANYCNISGSHILITIWKHLFKLYQATLRLLHMMRSKKYIFLLSHISKILYDLNRYLQQTVFWNLKTRPNYLEKVFCMEPFLPRK
jgi:hypothetical protein